MDEMPTESAAFKIVKAYRAQTIDRASAIQQLIEAYTSGTTSGITTAGAELLLDDWDWIEKRITSAAKPRPELLIESWNVKGE